VCGFRGAGQRQDDTVLGQQATDLVDQLRAAGNQAAANTMEALKVLLFN